MTTLNVVKQRERYGNSQTRTAKRVEQAMATLGAAEWERRG